MKTIKLLGTAIAVALLFGFTSCDEVEDVLPIPSIEATVDGTAWSSLASVGVLITDVTPQKFVITGKPTLEESLDKVLAITVNGNTAKTYNQTQISLNPDGSLNTDNVECVIAYTEVSTDGATTTYYGSTTSTVTISEIDESKKTLKGTFSGSLVNIEDDNDVIPVTNGTFKNIVYTEQESGL